MSDPNIGGMGLQEYSLTFGESLSKIGRHRLCLFCLREIEKDLIGEGKLPAPTGRGRGRPRSPATVLSIKIGVTYDTVKRWTDLSKIQACDSNAVKLAQVAYGYDPGETVKILRQDAESHRATIEDWISQRTPQAETGVPNITAGAYVENTGTGA